MANTKNNKEIFIRELAEFYDIKSMQDIYDAVKDWPEVLFKIH